MAPKNQSIASLVVDKDLRRKFTPSNLCVPNTIRDPGAGEKCQRRASQSSMSPTHLHRGHKKNGPRFNGGQVALVLSCCESSIGGQRRGSRRHEGSLRGWLHSYFCCSVPVEDAIPWGDVVPWAAKLFSINLICTVLGTRSRWVAAGFCAV